MDTFRNQKTENQEAGVPVEDSEAEGSLAVAAKEKLKGEQLLAVPRDENSQDQGSPAISAWRRHRLSCEV
ncbi:hypothetical protein PRBEI_2000598400 [Prionailurus iriomotensis]